MKFYYDLHIHSALSPCADDDMTPLNIVNMARLSGLDIIAITDHNSVKNVRSVMEASKRENGALIIAGMELTTSEDIHVILLFKDIMDAENCEKEVRETALKIKNKSSVFGSQIILDSFDKVIGEEENLLISATAISVENVPELAAKYNAFAFPAHIDKPSNGIIAILGDISPHLGFATVEVSSACTEHDKNSFRNKGYKILSNSDSHFLGVMNEQNDNFLELEKCDITSFFEYLKTK